MRFYKYEGETLLSVDEPSCEMLSVACDMLDAEHNERFLELKQVQEKEAESIEHVCMHVPEIIEGSRGDGTLDREVNFVKCSACDKNTNLWLCLTCGQLSCGRREYDGSGGNGHALQHFEKTRHPVCVKLTSLSANCQECYCYACDDSVDVQMGDLRLVLRKFGVDGLLDEFSALERSMDKEMCMNEALIQMKREEEENAGKKVPDSVISSTFLLPLYNVGNTCYANSVIEMLLSAGLLERLCPECDDLSDLGYDQLLRNFGFNINRILCAAEPQTDKLLYGARPHLASLLLSLNSYLTNTENIGRQEDCAEFLEVLLNNLPLSKRLCELPRFRKVIHCSGCGNVKFGTVSSAMELTLSCNFFDEATDVEQGMPIDLMESLQREYFGVQRPVYGYRCQYCNMQNIDGCEPAVRIGHSLINCQTLPSYLFIKANRIYYDAGAEKYAKLRTRIQGSEIIDLAALIDKTTYQEPVDVTSASPDVSGLVEVGIDVQTALKAFKVYNGNLDAIVDDFFNGCLKTEGGDDEDEFELWTLGNRAMTESANINTTYTLKAFVCHLGASYDVGHYVAYVRAGTHWIECNDNVLLYRDAAQVPMESAVMFLYVRLE